MQKAPSNGILHQLHQNYILLKFQNLISKTWNFLLRKMKFSIKNMKFSIKNMKFSIYEICQNSSFVLFVTEFSYHMYRKNAVLNGKQKQMKPLQYMHWNALIIKVLNKYWYSNTKPPTFVSNIFQSMKPWKWEMEKAKTYENATELKNE